MTTSDDPKPPSAREELMRQQALGYLSQVPTSDLLMVAKIHMDIVLERRKERAEAMRSFKVMLLEDPEHGFDDQSFQLSMHVIAKAARK